ncbi:MAG: hypothetical protein INR67_06155 [Jatrophihabitans endophyticus]|nr:hypothetical protein [Jatrophihabitans endophyticus]
MSARLHVTRGVWRDVGDLSDDVARYAALLTVLPADAVLAGRTAAAVHRLWMPDRVGERIEVIAHGHAAEPRAHAHSERGEIRIRRRRLHPGEIVVAEGVPVTSLARTWVDLAEIFSLEDLVAAGDCALRAGATTAELEECLSRAGRRRGVVRARAALHLLDRRSRSRPESHLRVGLVLRELPAPEVNVPIVDDAGQWLAEPDLSWKDVRLALEYNGRDHARLGRMRRDITREVDLGARGGWRTLTLGPVEVFRRMDQVASVVRELRRTPGPRPVQW